MPYNMSLVNGSGLVPFLQTTSEVFMQGQYGNLMLITLFVIMFMAFIKFTNNFKMAIGISSLFTAVFSVFLRALLLIGDQTVVIVWTITAIAALVAILTPD